MVFALSLPLAAVSAMAVWHMRDPVWLIPGLVAIAVIHLSLLLFSRFPWLVFGATCVGALMLMVGPPVAAEVSRLPGAVSAVLLPSTWCVGLGLYSVARWAVTYRWVAVTVALAGVAEVVASVWDGLPWLLAPTVPEAWRILVAALGVLAVVACFALGRWHAFVTPGARRAPVAAAGVEEPHWDPSAAIPQHLEQAVARQQARMAREVQVAVADNLENILSRAREGRNGFRRAPALAADALTDITQQGEEALGRVQSLLSLLSVTEAPGRQDEIEDLVSERTVLAPDDPLAPQPQLADLPRLIDAARGAGVPTSFTVDGERGELAVAAQLALYRTIQEALTNTARHAGPGAVAMVEVRWGAHDVAATIVDEAPPGPAEDALRADLFEGADYIEGRGLRVVRERLESLGGRLEVEQLADGYSVRGVVPRNATSLPA